MVERIRLLLETRQLSPTQFADAIGIARPIVSHILSGRNKPSLEVVQRILAAMPDLSMPWLLNGTGAMLAGVASLAAQPAPAIAVAPPAAALVAPEEPLPAASGPNLVAMPAKTSASQSIDVEKPAPLVSTPPVSKPTGATRPAPRRFTAPTPPPAAANSAPAPESVPVPESVKLAVPGEVPQTPVAATEPVPASVTPLPPASPVAIDGRPAAEATAAALFVGTEKPIRRIVIFYRDGSFADYQPE